MITDTTDQDRHMEQLVTIVGLGALGSHTALLLRNHPLRLIDFDRVEAKNIQAQHHNRMVLRQNKAVAMAKVLGTHGVKPTSIPHRLERDNQDQLLGGSTLVVDCVDNLVGRQTIQGWCRANQVACLHGCLSVDGQFGRVCWDEIFTPDAEDAEGQATCEGGENLPFHGLVGAMLAEQAQRYLRDGLRHSFELVGGSVRRI